MHKIALKFKNYPALRLLIYDTKLGKNFVKLIKDNYANSLPTYRDRIKYNTKYMFELARQAKEAFNWQWDIPEYDLEHTTLLHKDLERLLGTTGFQDVSEQYDHLLMEMHYCLHIVQEKENIGTRQGAFQVEWFNDTGFALDSNFEFGIKKTFGDVELLNPFVGHGPVQIFHENDYTNIPQTCKFHDFVKAGIVISTYDHTINRETILNYFQQHANEFVEKHGAEKIMSYTGFPKIGYIENLDDFKNLLAEKNVIELESMQFDI